MRAVPVVVITEHGEHSLQMLYIRREFLHPSGRRLRMTEDERRRLAVRACRLGQTEKVNALPHQS